MICRLLFAKFHDNVEQRHPEALILGLKTVYRWWCVAVKAMIKASWFVGSKKRSRQDNASWWLARRNHTSADRASDDHGRRVFHHLTRSVRSYDVHRPRPVFHLPPLRRHARPQQMVSDYGTDGPPHGNIHHHLQETWTRVEMVNLLLSFYYRISCLFVHGPFWP